MMGQNSQIQWCHHTWNPWRGCTKVSEGCANCYAEKGSHRNPKVLGVWGKHGTREVASESAWREPIKWNRWAAEGICYQCGGRGTVKDLKEVVSCGLCEGSGNIMPYRARVFCASLADVFEDFDTMPDSAWVVVEEARARLFRLIRSTPWLDWLLLTKRPGNIAQTIDRVSARIREDFNWNKRSWRNVWLGTSVENQQCARERIPTLLRDADSQVKFLSCQPVLGPLDLSPWLPMIRCSECGEPDASCHPDAPRRKFGRGVDWVIVGGESGSSARPFDLTWCEEIVNQCAAHGVPCFVKQFGTQPMDEGSLIQIGGFKGDDLDDWPEHLRVRQFPAVRKT